MNWFVVIAIVLVLFSMFFLKRLSWVSANQASALLKEGALVVDVRSRAEFSSSHLPGAINIPVEALGEGALRQIPDKNRPLLLHCLSGTRSAIARQALRQMGYVNVFNLGSYRRAETVVKAGRVMPN